MELPGNNDMHLSIKEYNATQAKADQEICESLEKIITQHLTFTESKIWHAHPVWFIKGNPIVGYSKRKAGVQLMFWSGADFGEDGLKQGSGKFKDASVVFTDVGQINETDLQRWLAKSEEIQWDYKNIVKKKGKLERLK